MAPKARTPASLSSRPARAPVDAGNATYFTKSHHFLADLASGVEI
jgi:hypothetical protein